MESKAGWCRWLQDKKCECATQVDTCPLLKSAWLEEWEKEAEKWLWLSGLVGGWEESRNSCVCIYVTGQQVSADTPGCAM